MNLIVFYRRRLLSLRVRLDITIGSNCFGKGLYVPHYGLIVVNGTVFLEIIVSSKIV